METGAKGCEVVVSGKWRGQRAKSMKFVDSLMIHSGDPCNDYVETATRHVLLRQGVLGIKVKIMLPYEHDWSPRSHCQTMFPSLNPRRRRSTRPQKRSTKSLH